MATLRPREDDRRRYERPHVLIVTDDSSLAEFLSEGLLVGGFWTSVISHGLQVLEVFRLRAFDMILLDRDLGTFDAMDLARRLRGDEPTSPKVTPRTNAPIILISSTEAAIGESESLALGIVDILLAPLELENVVSGLHRQFELWRDEHPDQPLADQTNAT
jgi:PleD family two-component response regulator